MTTDERIDRLAANAERHDSQIARLEPVLTALAEAQVKTEDHLAQLAIETRAAAAQGRKTQAALEDLSREWQAYVRRLAPQ